jgi:outer membrane protein assembly factor BamB
MKSFRFILSFLLLFITAEALRADWTNFRGPNGTCCSTETNVPITLGAPSNLAWRADLPGEGLSSPVIIGSRLFVTCSSGFKQQTLHILCFNTVDGSKLWERRFWATGRTMCNRKTSVAAPTPASDGRRVVAIFSSNDIICVDLDGNLLWFRGLGRDYPNASNNLGMSSSLVLADGVVIAQVESESDAFVAGLDAETGVNRWKLERPRKPNWSSPVLLNDKQVAVQSAHGVTVLEPATGKTIWEYLEGTSTIPSCTLAGGIVYVPSKGITALQPAQPGETPKRAWRSAQLRPGTASPVITGDKIFALSDSGILTCGNVTNGNRLWQLRLQGEFSATPLAIGNILYTVNEKGLIQVVDTSKPEGAIVSELDLAEKVLGTPSVSNGAIYFRGTSHLWRFGKPARAQSES